MPIDGKSQIYNRRRKTMPVELIKNPLKLCRIIGEEMSSTVVEEDINVPDVSPDVYKILYPSARVIIKNSETAGDKVIIDGQVLMNILYAADMEGRPLSCINASADFSHSIEMPGVKPRMQEWIDVVIQHVEAEMINARKIRIRTIMDINCMVEDIFDMDLPMDARGAADIQILRETFGVKELAGIMKDKYTIKEEMELSPEKPAVDEVLKTDFKAAIKDLLTMEGKLQISGVLCFSILYKSSNEGSIETHEGEIPFTEYIEMPEADSSMESTADLQLKDCYLDVYENEAGENKKISINANMDLTGKTYKDMAPEIVSDLYSPTCELEAQKESYEFDEFVGRGIITTVIKESLSINPKSPEIEKVCSMDARVIPNEVKVMDDKVAVEGTLDVDCIYASSFSGEPMNALREQYPFRAVLDMVGVKTEMHPKVVCRIDSISFSAISNNIIDFRIVIATIVDVYKKKTKKLIDKVEEKEGIVLDYNTLPAVTVYVVGKNDTLWKIAKKYNTTVDAIAKVNNIENPDKINEGDKILIMKNMRLSKK